ncbi:Serine/threonine-protein kinase fray2 [Linum perenne]
MEKKKYPIGPENYVLYEEIGQGVSATVHRALCVPFDEIVAIKILDFERDNVDLANISREVQTMILVDHSNVLKSHCSFVSDHNLWVVMPFMAGGSCLHILKAAFPEGFEEVVIATILREVLKGLEYLHHHGCIHRDVKAGNILIDERGSIKLGDLGVSAYLFGSGDRQRMRNTFVGTPCWMAPEVMEQLHGYDVRADIWSFGITALELAHGHAPFSKYPPMKVLLMTLQNAPPGLDYERDKKFSKSFKQMIASCLVKDPSKRPTAKKLLKHSFFKQARSNDYLSRTILEGLPALGERIKALKRKEENMLAEKKMPDGQMEEISQNEYKRGISGWNFNLDDMKAQASLIPDDEILVDNCQGSSTNLLALDGNDKQYEARTSSEKQATETADNHLVQNGPVPLLSFNSSLNIAKINFEKSDDECSLPSPSDSSQLCSPRFDTNIAERPTFEIDNKIPDGMPNYNESKLVGPGSLSFNFYEPIVSQSKFESSDTNIDKSASQLPRIPSNNGAMVAPDGEAKLPGSNEEIDEKTKPPVVQQRGRFKVTSESVDMEKVAPSPLLQKSFSMQVITQNPGIPLSPTPEATSSSLIPSSVFPLVQSVLQTNILQRDAILGIMKHLSNCEPAGLRASEGGSALQLASMEKSLMETTQDREKELVLEVTDLRYRLICAQEELQKYKTETAQVSNTSRTEVEPVPWSHVNGVKEEPNGSHQRTDNGSTNASTSSAAAKKPNVLSRVVSMK